jgi:hypothetical protein
MEKKNRKTEVGLTRFNPKLAAAVIAAIGMAAPAFGESINALETSYTGTNIGGASIGQPADPAAVIDAFGSKPGVVDGYTYTSYAMIDSDGTGSLEIFGKIPTSSSYVPTVGDAIAATGTYSPFDAIPELESLTAISQVSTSNTIPAPVSVTIPQLNALESSSYPSNFAIQDYILALNNVTIDAVGGGQATGNFPTHANGTYSLVDGNVGDGTLTMYLWASSYSAAGAYGGTAIPQGPVDITGICDVFSGAPNVTEFVPFSIVAVPEPASIGLLGLGAAMLLRRRNKAEPDKV